jgi:hypothetical protein
MTTSPATADKVGKELRIRYVAACSGLRAA